MGYARRASSVRVYAGVYDDADQGVGFGRYKNYRNPHLNGKQVNRDALWVIIIDRAIEDRMAYRDAWSNTGDDCAIAEIATEIAGHKALKKHAFMVALAADREGVRLAMLAAECWCEGLFGAQVSSEKKAALTKLRQVRDLRKKLFGLTINEVKIQNSVSVPMHKIQDVFASGLTPMEYLVTLKHQ